MEAIKTYYRAQRPSDYDPQAWDKAIDLLLAENQDSREVGRTILKANGADMFPFDFLLVGFPDFPSSEPDDFAMYGDYCVCFSYEGFIEIAKGSRTLLNIGVNFVHDKEGINWIDTFFCKISSRVKIIKSALGLQ